MTRATGSMVRTGFDRWTTWTTAAAAGLALAFAPAASAQADEGAGEAPPQKTVVAFDYSGWPAVFENEKDAGLAQVPELLRARLDELRANPELEADLGEIPPQVWGLAYLLLDAPASMRMTLGGFDPNTGWPDFGLVMQLGAGGEAEARRTHERVEFLRSMAGGELELVESDRYPGMLEFGTPMGPVLYGPRETVGGEWVYQLIAGNVGEPDAWDASLPATPGGDRAISSFRMDLAALTPLANFLRGWANMAGPEGEMMFDMLEQQGVIGEDAMGVDAVSWRSETHLRQRLTYVKARPYAASMNFGFVPLDTKDLRAIPRNAYAALAHSWDPEASFEAAWELNAGNLQLSEEQVEEMAAEIRERFGIDPREDVLEPLGTTVAMYISDSTGGNSLLSTVLLHDLERPTRMASSLNKLYEKSLEADAGWPELPVGAMRVERGSFRGATTFRLLFPGLPVPFEPTVAVAGDWLVAGVTPGAVEGAIVHLMDDQPSILDNDRFRALPVFGGEPVSFSFIDTTRTITDGYPVMQLLVPTLESFLRSPAGDREVPRLMPTLPELARGLQPSVTVLHWDGENAVYDTYADPSMLATLTALAGTGDLGALVTGFVGGALVGSEAAKNNMGGAGWDGGDWDDEGWDGDGWEEWEPAEEPEPVEELSSDGAE